MGNIADPILDKVISKLVETPGARLRRLAFAARSNNPVTNSKLVGSVPWTISTVYTLGQVVSNGGFAYVCITAGTSAASGGPTGRALNQTDNTAHWDYIGPQTAPVVIANIATHNAALTKQTNLNQGLANGALITDNTGIVRWRGGAPQVHPTNIGVGTPSATVTPQAGNFTATMNMYYEAFEFLFEGTILELQTVYGNSQEMSVIVDGQYVDYPVVCNPSFNLYTTIDFTNVASSIDTHSGVGRQRHRIIVEISGNNNIPMKLSCGPADTVNFAQVSDNFSVAVIGDSQVSGGGTEVNTKTMQMYPIQIMHLLGLPDICCIGIGGTGIVNPGAATPFIGHAVSDLNALNAFRKIGLIICPASQNDDSQTGVQAAARALFQAIRAAFPSVPIIVPGELTPSGSNLTNAQANETAVLTAVAQQQAAGDSLIFSYPCATDPNGPWIAGTGHVGATNGSGNNDFETCSDASHLSSQGHTSWAARSASAIYSVLAGMP